MRVSALAIYPVKGLRPIECAEAVVERPGLRDDRRWAAIRADGRVLTQREVPAMAGIGAEVLRPGVVRLAALEPGVRAAAGRAGVEAVADGGAVTLEIWGTRVACVAASGEASAWLSAALGVACRLVYLADPAARAVTPELARDGDTVSLADGFPLLVTGTASLAAVNGRLAAPVPMGRFRANLVVETAVPWEEDGWSHVTVGSVRLRLASACSRCKVTTLDQATGAVTARGEPLRTLGAMHRDAEGRITFGWNAIPETMGTIRLGDRVEPVPRTA